ncbi:uncharacterized protein LOC106662900 isoform X2 [Cimex lectularius]|uniref:Uncharacterized protein n=1 Tax=Cimex lectularius TaxID=79782 RepID=A0A8I6RBA4_CIMLE|nr:uncharacterized protein LOC106662900 isoform X2 [Cimex lectularius]
MDPTDPYIPLKMSKAVYRNFIEESGIMEAFTLFLFRLIDEKTKPPYLIHYFRKHFGYKISRDMPNIHYTWEQIEQEKRKLEALQMENVKLKHELSFYDTYYEMRPLRYRFPIMPELKAEREKNPDGQSPN